MKSFMQKKEEVKRVWYVIDATDLVVGRLATEVANLLRGKNKPTFTPHIDGGDYVVITNAEKVRFTGDKLQKKIYYKHSLYPGGLTAMPAEEVLKRKPERVLEEAVKGMLPKNRIGADMFRRLFVYVGPEHKQKAQKPIAYEVKR